MYGKTPYMSTIAMRMIGIIAAVMNMIMTMITIATIIMSTKPKLL